ncbi:MAG: helix-turn-helix domain-containing protein [Candidatus Thorarchaeota archaeon]
MPANSYEELLQSVGVVKACRSWFILDVYRPVFGWYAEHIGFTHPERAERLQFQLACDAVWGVRGLDGFDLDLLVIVGLREVGSVADVARRFKVREDFLFKVFQRLQKLGWIEGVEKQKFTTVFRTTSAGELFLERTLNRMWDLGDRVVVRNTWWQRLRDGLMDRFGSAAAVARRVGMPETTVRGYLQGRRQWMHARWVVALAQAVGWGREQVSAGIVVAFARELAPRYEQCDFLAKDLGGYRRFCAGEISFDAWLEGRQIAVVREAQLLDVGFAEKLQSASAIRDRIIALAKAAGGEISLGVLKADGVLQTLVADRYPAYVADRMAKLVNQGVFVRIAKGRYRIFWKELLDHLRIQ